MRARITFSTFELFCAGHEKILKEAKCQGDSLIIGLGPQQIVGKQSIDSQSPYL